MGANMYGHNRIRAIDITEAQNNLTAFAPRADAPTTIEMLKAFDDGNLHIRFFELQKRAGHFVQASYDADYSNGYGNLVHGTLPYYIVRLAKPKDDKKYDNPTGTPAIPFLCRNVIDAYNDGQPIETLVLVEGALKALSASLHGIYCIGLNGIWGLRSKGEKELHPWIREVVEQCKVKHLVYLHDADARAISTGPGKDLLTRPKNFADSVWAFKQGAKLLPKRHSIWYAHIHDESEQKGLDDLLAKNDPEKVVEAIITKPTEGGLIVFNDVAKWSKAKIYEYFYIDTVQRFYDRHREQIGDLAFVYGDDLYQLAEDGESVECILRGAVAQYIFVGSRSFKLIYENNSKGFPELVRDPRGLDSIRRELKTAGIKGNDLEEAIIKIPSYEGFANEPDFLDYKKDITVRGRYKFINLAYPMPHKPEPGDWPNIEGFLRHIFANNGDDKYDVGLDMMQMYYTMPKQKQRILSLVSEANETGKSTFLQLLREMFGQNMSIIGNTDFQSQFNPWVTKSILGIDESKIAAESIAKLKTLVTSTYIHLNDKNVPSRDVINYAKLVMTSNEIYDFAAVGESENKWFVVDVSPIGRRDAELPSRMFAEIPHFLYFLLNRKMVHFTRESRFAISDEVVKTEAVIRLKETGKPQMQKLLEHYLKELFDDFTFPNDEFIIDALRLNEALYGTNVDYRVELKNLIKQKYGITPSKKAMWMKIPKLVSRTDVEQVENGVFVNQYGEVVEPFNVEWKSLAGKCFTFKKEDFI